VLEQLVPLLERLPERLLVQQPGLLEPQQQEQVLLPRLLGQQVLQRHRR
jgi:hypothetical protein